MANVYQQAFEKYLEEKDFHYQELRDNIVRVGISGLDHVNNVALLVIFDEGDGRSVAMRATIPGANFKDDSKMSQGLSAANLLNMKYRWAKFYIDNDRDLIAETDELVSEETSGSELFELVIRMATIIDESYPTIMKIVWG